MDIVQAEKFKEQLLTVIGNTGKVIVDASEVERITTPCIQLFIAADQELSSTGGKNGGGFKIIHASDITIQALKDIGLEKKYIEWSS